MAKMPFFQFYPLDWLRDTAKISPSSQGHWIKILCLAWNEPERGVYRRKEMEACYELGLDAMRLKDLLDELQGVADVTFSNDIVTVKSRRMVREENRRESGRGRSDRYRRNAKVTPASQPDNANVTDNKSEVRSQKSEVIKDKDNSKDSGEKASPGSVAAVVLPGSSIPAKKPTTPQAEFVEGFRASYESMVGQPFKFKKEHFIITDRLIKEYGMEMVVKKTQILGVLCRDKSAWFTKGGWADFSIEKLSSQWNSILETARQESIAEKDARETAEIRAKVRAQREQLDRTMGR